MDSPPLAQDACERAMGDGAQPITDAEMSLIESEVRLYRRREQLRLAEEEYDFRNRSGFFCTSAAIFDSTLLSFDQMTRVVFNGLGGERGFMEYAGLEKGLQELGLPFAGPVGHELWQVADYMQRGRIELSDWKQWASYLPTLHDALYECRTKIKGSTSSVASKIAPPSGVSTVSSSREGLNGSEDNTVPTVSSSTQGLNGSEDNTVGEWGWNADGQCRVAGNNTTQQGNNNTAGINTAERGHVSPSDTSRATPPNSDFGLLKQPVCGEPQQHEIGRSKNSTEQNRGEGRKGGGGTGASFKAGGGRKRGGNKCVVS
eukprot:Hpha_TRINITY_DN16556_c3_g2::TRINITY_DN16556_c3_g2_i5::g.135783::m.135783